MGKRNNRLRLLALLLAMVLLLGTTAAAMDAPVEEETGPAETEIVDETEEPAEEPQPEEEPEETPSEPDTPTEGTDDDAENGEETSLPFEDVQEGRWFYPYVQYAYERGLMDGNSATEFLPTETTTRAMVVTVLYRLAGSPEAGASDFSDVDRNRWYVGAVDWAVEQGITLGMGDGTFGPDEPVTREQLVAFLYRFVGYLGGETDQRANLNLYSDRKKISNYAVPCIKWAVGAGLLEGRTDTKLEPKGEATRAELAAFLYKLEQQVLSQEQAMHPETANVPVLIFHSVTTEPEDTASITMEEFASAMEMLYQGGYEAVSYQQLIDYVDNGTALPEKPVVITFDDGYRDNLENAYPILRQYGYCCEIAVIGSYVGLNEYDGGQIIPHFALEEILELEPGTVAVQSHTMRMHMLVDREDLSLGRRGVERRSSETRQEYEAALRADFSESYQQIGSVLAPPVALTYPYGIYTVESEEAAREVGYRISVTIHSGSNILTVGNEDCLWLLNRVSIDGTTTLEEFEEMIQVG